MEKLTFYKLAFYVPESHLEPVKQALFAAGAGKQGNYDQACWQCLGQGQFRALEAANPVIGNKNFLTLVPEYKVEVLCSGDCITEVIHSLKAAHPYEEPAFEVVRLENSFE